MSNGKTIAQRGLVALALTGALVATGCGTIMGYDDPQPINVNSNPEGGKIEVDGKAGSGVTPAVVNIVPDGDHRIVVKKDGFLDASTSVTKVIRVPVVIADGFLTLGIGVLVDYLTGGLYKFKESSVKLNLGKHVEPTPVKQPDPKKPEQKKPCTTCSEPRGDVSPCPHCGVD